tara:strand:+ start:9815 stop:11116 length:1302 start_codon:yes stop_codon:yes gene_type:complete
MYNILEKKKHRQALQDDEIQFVIQEMMDDTIKDYQIAAFLMACYCQGMDDAETAALTDAMLYSGKTLSFSEKNIVDKHSTGGIGDKTSFILAPIASACGVKVPMIAGRGLGFTGGTVDKVEAIPGFNTDLTLEQFEKRLIENNIVLMGQTDEIAPADKKIYALRDVTATIDSIPLITASIMSKKLAEGANGIVLDIKVGNGAFMRDMEQASELAKSINATAKRFKKKSACLLTNMSQPLGQAVGHSLEIIECIETLKGKGPKDLTEISVELAAHMIVLAEVCESIDQARDMATQAIANGSALQEFKKLIAAQEGNDQVVENYDLLPLASEKTQVLASQDGTIHEFVTDQIGFQCTELGGGRKVKSDKIDYGVGFIFHKKLGEQVKKGEELLTIYHNKDQQDLVAKISERMSYEYVTVKKEPLEMPQTIYKVIH